MHAIIFKKENNEIIGIIKDVKDFNNDNIGNRVFGLSDNVDFIITDNNLPELSHDFDLMREQIKKLKLSKYTNIRPEKEFEKKLAVKREQRNTLLLETDHYMMPDYPISKEKQEEIKDYRQSLRDLPETITKENIDTITFPEKPNLQTSVKSQ